MLARLRVRPGMTVACPHVPPDYPRPGTTDAPPECDVVHLFVGSRSDFVERFPDAAGRVRPGGLFWLSYPKATGKTRYDINRDSLWDLVLPLGWHPVAQMSLDATWSAIRLMRHEPGRSYERPGTSRA